MRYNLPSLRNQVVIKYTVYKTTQTYFIWLSIVKHFFPLLFTIDADLKSVSGQMKLMAVLPHNP